MTKAGTPINRRLSVAPMMDWTDRHCRYLHRLLSRHTLLYTEMVTAAAVVHGDRDRLLGFHPAEDPVALQLGGSEPDLLAQATRIGCDFGYHEINLNVGCPSDRVQSGRFGACLMQEPTLVVDCLMAMIDAANDAEITVKCRIGVDDQDPHEILPDFVEMVTDCGIKSITIHARKAWMQGLSPKENRQIPQLDYELVHRIKTKFPMQEIIINGGISSLDQALEHLEQGLDGVMIGRMAYHNPADVLCAADRRLFGAKSDTNAARAVRGMIPYIEDHLITGGKLNHITRHMLGLFSGQTGARKWRRILSENAHKPGAGPEVVLQALAQVGNLQETG